MAHQSAHLSVVEGESRPAAGPLGRVLVGFDAGERFDDALTLARRLVDRDAGRICVCHPLDGRHERITPEHADAVVVPSAPRAPEGRVLLDRRLLRLLRHTIVPVAVAPAGHRETGPFHHIGVALDDTPGGAAAVACAYALAARDRSAVTLVRALPVVADGVGLRSEREHLREHLAVQEQLGLAAQLAPPGVNPRVRLLHGNPATVLPKAFDGLVDLVVCGSHGYGALMGALIGSVSRALLEDATQPVLVVRSALVQTPVKERTT